MKRAFPLLIAGLLVLSMAGPALAQDPTPVPTPAPPDPACPTGFPVGSTADDSGDSCYFISGKVVRDGQPLSGVTVTAKIVPSGGNEPAIGTYVSTTGEDGSFRLGVLPGNRWRVLVRLTPDGTDQLIELSTGAAQAEDAVFNIGAAGRIALDIVVDGEGTVRGDFDAITLQVLTPTPAPAQYNPLTRSGDDAALLSHDTEFLAELAAIEAAERNPDALTLFNLFVGLLAAGAVGWFALRLTSSPMTVAEQLGNRRRRDKASPEDEISALDDLFGADDD